ncbi:T9SS type A sorting domain-containing protein [Gelidibacter sp. F63206]|uniref:T9SS type A sorting domain-containing protein n=1 Tax=Gelidibacter sp. F63206 TaxID=2926425 RepID=UPI001FF6C956|nr:T9SS type A sorting domain-containing protein [Gelidibacter sp. F63206]MCK0114797.1 T9SS type A sorting domain-containing protein [Gelidibacter sp. F63206]
MMTFQLFSDVILQTKRFDKMRTKLHHQKPLLFALLYLSVFLFYSGTLAQTWNQLGADFTGSTNAEFAKSVSISADGNTVAFGQPTGGPSIGNRVLIYTLNGSNWAQKGSTIISSTRGGESVSLSADGNIVCIGANQSGSNGSNSGLAQVYQYIGSNWQQMGSNILGENIGDFFGYKVKISSDGNTFAASSPFADFNGVSDAGRVRIYTYNGTNWILKGNAINPPANRSLGRTLDMDASGNTLIISGANLTSSGAGVISVYAFNGTDWVQKGQEILGVANEGIGREVAISADGNIIAYSALNTSKTGQVKVFTYNGAQWTQLGSDMDGENSNDSFGSSLSMSANGTILAIGANGVNVQGGLQAGTVTVNQFNGVDWIQVGQVVTGSANFDLLGSALSLSSDGNTYVVAQAPRKATAFVYRISQPLSLDDRKFSKITLFPNPTNGSFSLSLGHQVETLNLNIFNMLGQVVLSRSYTSVERVENLSVKDPGLYFIKISNSNGGSQTLRLLVN